MAKSAATIDRRGADMYDIRCAKKMPCNTTTTVNVLFHALLLAGLLLRRSEASQWTRMGWMRCNADADATHSCTTVGGQPEGLCDGR